MQAIGRQPHRAPDGAPVHYERHRPGQTTLYRLVQQHAATFFAEAEAAAGADLPQFVKDADGGITFYVQNESPGKDKEPNWLPAPKGPFAAAMRLYWPKEAALDGTWKHPPMTKTP